ncbi:MAG: hypothetical protein ACLFSQ_10200, partial [Candidatus Zixiibacteriota bacterium]
MKRLVILGLLLCIALMVAEPHRVSYQGKITNAYNVGVSGTYDITFRIYDDGIYGTRLDMTTVSDVPVDKGLFTVYFMVDLTPEQLSSDLWLDIEFDGERMIPRQLITSEIKAVYSENAGYAISADSSRIAGTAYFTEYADSSRISASSYFAEEADSARIAYEAYIADQADTSRVAGISHWAEYADSSRIAATANYSDTAGAVNWDDIQGMPDVLMAGMDLQDVIFVAKNGDDAIADGSHQLPYLTIGAATADASGGEAIVVAPGTYSENVTLPANCNFYGYGQGKTIIDGHITTTSGTCALQDFSVLDPWTITLNTTTSAVNIFTYGNVEVDGDLQAFNLTIWERTGTAPALKVNSGIVSINSGTIKDDAGGGHVVIRQYGGQIVLNTTQILGGLPSTAIINSSGGNFVATNSYIMNVAGGLAANLNNDGDATTPNTLNNVLLAGNVNCNSSVTIANSYEGGNVYGSALMGMKHGGIHRFPQKAQSGLTTVDDNDSTLTTKSYVDDKSFTRLRVGSFPWNNDSLTFIEGERVSLNLSGDSLEIGFAADSNYIYAQDSLSQVAGFWVDGPGIVGGATKTGPREVAMAEGDDSSVEYPFHGEAQYWRSTALITAEELATDGGDLTSFFIKLADVTSTSPNFTWSDFRVWIEPTAATSVPAAPSTWDVSGADEVIAPATLVLPKELGWHEITLDVPWTYDGTSNLIIYFEGITTLATYTADGPAFSNSDMGTGDYMAYASDATSLPTTLMNVTSRPDFKFNFTDATWEIGEVNMDDGNIMADGDIYPHSFTLNDTTITSWYDLSNILGTGDTLSGTRHDTIVVDRDFKIMGELIADSIQAVGPTLTIDDTLDVNGNIYGQNLDISERAVIRDRLSITGNTTVGNDLMVGGTIYGAVAGGIAFDTLQTRDSTITDTLVVANQMKVLGELIADSIQAAGDTIFLDDITDINGNTNIAGRLYARESTSGGTERATGVIGSAATDVDGGGVNSATGLYGWARWTGAEDLTQSIAGVVGETAPGSGANALGAMGIANHTNTGINAGITGFANDGAMDIGATGVSNYADFAVAMAAAPAGDVAVLGLQNGTSDTDWAGYFDGKVDITGDNNIGGDAAIGGKAKSDLTLGGDNDSTLTTKSYVDAQMGVTSTDIDAEIHVAKNGDDATGDGSIEKPFLTIAAAVAEAATIHPTHTFVTIIIHTGEYQEGIILEDAALERVWIKGIGTVNIEPSAGNAFQSTANNDNLAKLKVENISFGAPFVIAGSSGSTAFGDVIFNNCNWVVGNGGRHGTIDLTAVNNFTVKNAYITETMTFNNLNWSYFESSQIQGDIAFNYDGSAIAPDWGTDAAQIWNGIYFSGAPTFNVSNGGTFTLVPQGCRIASTDVTLPAGATVYSYNSFLRGEWTVDGTLNLRNSQVQGGIADASTGTVNYEQFDAQIANTSTVPGATVKEALDNIDNSLAFDTLFAGLKADATDTVVAYDNFKVHGELIADSIQAVGDTVFVDDHLKIDNKIIGDTIHANNIAVGLEEAEFEIHSLGEMVAQNDNSTSFRLRGPQHSTEGTDTVQSYAGIFYHDAYSSTSSSGLKTRAVYGANVEMDLSLQGPRQVRITAVDDTQPDGQIRMASRTDLVIHPRTLAEQNTGNYLMIDMEDETSSATANTSPVEIATSSGDLLLNPFGMLYVNDNAKFMGKAKSDLTVVGDNDSTLVTKSYTDSLNAVTVTEFDTIYADTKVDMTDTVIIYDNMAVKGHLFARQSTTGGTERATGIVGSAATDVAGGGVNSATGVYGWARWTGVEDLTQSIAALVGETAPGSGANALGAMGIANQANTGINVGVSGFANAGAKDFGVAGASNYADFNVAMAAAPAADIAVLGMQNGSGATDYAGYFDGKIKVTEKAKSDLTLIGDGDSTLTTKSYVDAQILAGGADNLGNHTATMDLDMAANSIDNADSVNANMINIAGSTDHHNLIIGSHMDASPANLFAAIDAEVEIDTAWAGTETTQGIYNRTNLNHPSGDGPAIAAGYNGVMSVITNAASTGEVIGGNFAALNEGLARTDDLIGIQTKACNDSLGQATRAFGIKVEAGNMDNGSVDNGYGSYIHMKNMSSSGTLANSYGTYIATPINDGTLTNNYGLYIENHAGVGSSSNYAIYVEGGKSILGGDADVGANLSVSGASIFGNDITVTGGADILDNSLIDGNLIVTGTIFGDLSADSLDITFDTLLTPSNDPAETLVVYAQTQIYGELIADSIQAIADTIYMDDNVYVAGNIICDTTENTDNDNVVVTKSYVDAAITSGGADDMGDHTATMTLDMAGYDIENVDTLSGSSVNLTGHYTQNTTLSPTVTGSDYYVNQTSTNITTTDDIAAHYYQTVGVSSDNVRGILSEAYGDGDYQMGVSATGIYQGANTSTDPTDMPEAAGLVGYGSIDNGTLSARSMGVYGASSDAQIGNNYGVLGYAANADNSNIGVLAVSNATSNQIQALSGGANGVGLYAYNPSGGWALYADGTANITGAVTANSTLDVGGNIILQNDETISNSVDGTIALGGDVTVSGDFEVTGTSTIPGYVIGTDVQAWDDDLDDISALTPLDGNILVGDGTDWVAESDATARTSLGLGTTDSPVFAGLEANGTITLENDETISNSVDGTIELGGDVNITGHITGDQKITGKAQSDLTAGGDSDSTLTTKSYVDGLSETSTQTDNTWYVSTTGDDGTGNGSIAAPYLTIGAALTAATAGDHIMVLSGSYPLSSALDVNKAITISGVAGKTDVSRTDASAAVNFSASGVVWENIDIVNPGTGVALDVTSTGTNGIEIKNSAISDGTSDNALSIGGS